MTDVDPETLNGLEADLRAAVGKEQAITSGELADRNDITDSDANPKTRKLVKEVLVRERGLPIVGCSQGYYIPTHRGPIDEYLDSLRGRIANVEDRMAIVERNWQQWSLRADGGQQVAEDSDDGESEWAQMSEDQRQKVREDDVLEPSDFGGETDE